MHISFSCYAHSFLFRTFYLSFSCLIFDKNEISYCKCQFEVVSELFCYILQRLPGWWRWYYWANPIAWSLYGLLTSQYGDLDEPMKLWDGVHSVSIRKFLRDYFEYRHDFLGIAGIMVVSFCVLFAFIYAFAIKSFNFQRR